MKVLIVDDSSVMRDTLRDAIELFGHEVEDAVDGAQGLEKFSAGGFDLVVSDIEMPRMSGFDLAREIKRQFPQLPVILLSGAFEYFKDAVSSLGVSGLAKPFSLAELESHVQTALQTQSR